MGDTALVFNIQHYSLHDGPGIRSIVFLKGCPLRCRWCCNPESQRVEPELSYFSQKCIGWEQCGLCIKVCKANAILKEPKSSASVDVSKNKKIIQIGRLQCTNCLDCAGVCPSQAIRIEGKSLTITEILDQVEKNAAFFRHGKGGLTVSGGEPLSQGVFLTSLLREAKKRRLNTAMETCGFGDYGILREAALYLDTILFDIKSLDDEKHYRYTGQSNKPILDNFVRLCKEYRELPKLVRTPVIPNFNNTSEDQDRIRLFLEDKPNTRWETLPYHRFGEGKYAALGKEIPGLEDRL